MCVLGCLLLVTLSMAAISIGVGAGEGWTPVAPTPDLGINANSPSGPQKTPILIEWDGTTAVIHRNGGTVAVKWSKPSGFLVRGKLLGLDESSGPDNEYQWLSIGDVPESDKEFHKRLKELEGLRKTHYVLFAVRPSGFKTFHRLADEFRGRKIDVGYEPIRQERPVRLILEEPDHVRTANANAVR